MLVSGSFNYNYKYYESRGYKHKEISFNQSLYKIMSYLSDLINDIKTIENYSNESKI